MLIGCAETGISISVACPIHHRPMEASVKIALGHARRTKATIEIVNEPDTAVRSADIVVTDSFVSMGSEKERDQRLETFLPKYQVNRQLMEKAKPDACFMHCLPAHRGEEVTPEVIDGPRSLVWQEAGNRLHAQKALMCLLLLDRKVMKTPNNYRE
jgi:ornithine carbamoyltransferase